MLVFLCSPISDSSYNQLHLPAFPILPALLGCHCKSGQVWPHGMEPIISNLSRRPCNQRELLPSPTLGGIRFHPLGSKHGHSYLTYLWKQLKVIDMLNDWLYQGLAAKLLLPKTAMNGPVLCVPSPLAQACGGEDILYIYISNISWTPWALDPITNPFLWPSSWLHPASGGRMKWLGKYEWIALKWWEPRAYFIFGDIKIK